MKERILDSMGRIGDDLIERVDALRRKSRVKSGWIRWGAAAACLCLIAGGALLWSRQSNRGDVISCGIDEAGNSGIVVSADGVTIPKMNASLSANEAADMIAFFIYQGNWYVQYEWIDDADLVGEYLGTATGLIDEWTPKDGYVELAGSVKGPFYSVKGIDPGFMLCKKDETGAVSTYICDNGITLRIGSDLYEDRLHLSEQYIAVQAETRDSWYYGRSKVFQLDADDKVIGEFITQLDRAEFIPWEDVPAKEGMTSTSIYDTEIYHLYFKMKNGMTTHLRLYEHGYVRFQGLLSVCVQLPEESFSALTDALKNQNGTEEVSVPNRTEIMLEKCRNDPELGGYLPTFEVPGCTVLAAETRYYLDPETAAETGTKELHLEYTCDFNPNLYYSVTVTWRDEYGRNGWAGPMLEQTELSAEALAERMGTKQNGVVTLHVGVWFGDVAVVLSASGLDAWTAFQILDSVR
ncbi:MAG: hypothetical protein E7576_02480 [Ruminococcaceae bacterium]|jgi:hypothetical protein|nr:hypothetical protein [Oscillospiraceae bacterium]